MSRLVIAAIAPIVIAVCWLSASLTHYNRVVIDGVNHPDSYEWRLDWPKGVEWELCDDACKAKLAALPDPTSVECSPGWVDGPCCIVTFGESRPSLLTKFGTRFVPFWGMSLKVRPPGSHEVHLKREGDSYRFVLFSGITNRPPKQDSEVAPTAAMQP